MASSQEYPHGLNQWTGSDKPELADFLHDNKLLDESVLWKEDYDPDGVIPPGGIPAWGLAAADYDADRAVAEAGGIAAAINAAVQTSQADVMLKSQYAPDATAEVVDGVLVIHSLTPHPTTSYAVSFIAPENHDIAMPVSIDDVTMTVVDMLGHSLVSAWSEGAPVTLIRVGTKAYLATMPLPDRVPASPAAEFRIRNVYYKNSTAWPAGAVEGDILAVY